jgi:hypothetical protein
MDKIGSLVFTIGLLTFVFLMPMWIAIAVRLIFRRTTKRRILAVLTALPFTIWLISKSLNKGGLLPDLEDWNKYGTTFTITMTVIEISISLLISFFFPYRMAEAGIDIGDRIMKKRSKWIEVKPDIAPKL